MANPSDSSSTGPRARASRPHPVSDLTDQIGRRRALQVIGGAAALPLLPAELFANAHLVHVHLHQQETRR